MQPKGTRTAVASYVPRWLREEGELTVMVSASSEFPSTATLSELLHGVMTKLEVEGQVRQCRLEEKAARAQAKKKV